MEAGESAHCYHNHAPLAHLKPHSILTKILCLFFASFYTTGIECNTITTYTWVSHSDGLVAIGQHDKYICKHAERAIGPEKSPGQTVTAAWPVFISTTSFVNSLEIQPLNRRIWGAKRERLSIILYYACLHHPTGCHASLQQRPSAGEDS